MTKTISTVDQRRSEYSWGDNDQIEGRRQIISITSTGMGSYRVTTPMTSSSLQQSTPARQLKESQPEVISNPYFKAIGNAIDKARSILDLQYDWDDEGAAPITEESWKQVMLFLVKYFLWAKKNQIIISAPKIFPTRDGGIDLVWRLKTHRLAFRIPGNSQPDAIYTGQLLNGQEIDGSFLINDFSNEENISKLKKTLEVFHSL